MSFPNTGELDGFTRANGALGTGWDGPIFAGDDTLAIVSDQAAPPDETTGGYAEAYRTTTLAAACEVWAKFTSTTGQPFVMACLTDPNTSSPSGYIAYALSDTEVLLGRMDAGDLHALDDWSGLDTIGAGGLGFDVAADGTITAYYLPAGGSWTLLGAVSDDTYTSGKIGLGYWNGSDPEAAFTSFGGGGTYTGGGASIPDATRPVPAVPPARRGLLLTVCDLTGAPLVEGSSAPLPVQTPDQPQVTIPLSDSRTGQLAVSMYEPIAGALEAATTVVKCVYINPKGDAILVLNGMVLNPQEDYDAATVTVTLHDHTIRLKKRYLGYNHYSIMLGIGDTVSDGNVNAYTGGDFNGITSDYGIPLDGTGLRLMMMDTSHGASDWPGGGFTGIPSMGIRPGVDNANRQPVYGVEGIPPAGVDGWTATTVEGSDTLTSVDMSGATWADGTSGTPTWADLVQYAALYGTGIADFAQIVSTDEGAGTIQMSQPATANGTAVAMTTEAAIYCQLSRGDCVYDDWTDMVQAQGAFECDFIPIDKANLGISGGTWEAGQFVELYTDNRVGTDRSQSQTAVTPVVFVHGIGGFHLVASPDADQLITYEVQVGPGGPWDPLDILNKITMNSSTGVETYGVWEDWEQNTSAGTGDSPISNQTLADRAEAVLTGYQNPPKFLTCTIDIDEVSQYCYGTDFFLGDTVTVYAKKGYRTLGPMDVRITSVGITQVDHDGNCQLTLTLVPFLTADAGISED